VSIAAFLALFEFILACHCAQIVLVCNFQARRRGESERWQEVTDQSGFYQPRAGVWAQLATREVLLVLLCEVNTG
jgi:hypothetical protein